MGISSPSLSLLNECHRPDLLLLANGNDGIKQHFFCSIEEAYYLVKEMLFVSVIPRSIDCVFRAKLVTSLMVVRAYILVTSLAPQTPRDSPMGSERSVCPL